jgi:hypothetical protein
MGISLAGFNTFLSLDIPFAYPIDRYKTLMITLVAQPALQYHDRFQY